MNELHEDEFQSLSDRAYEFIYNMILTGQLKPGEKLIRRKLAKESGMSTIPILEALLRLEAAGFVESMPYRGSRVVKVTYEKIMDWYALREAVECQVARILAGKIKPYQLRILEDMANSLDEKEQAGETGEEFWELHHKMHNRMAEFTARQSLIDALKRINFFNLLQRAQISASEHINQIPADNHLRIVQALKAHDPQIAEEAMREHIYHSGIFDAKKGVYADPSPLTPSTKTIPNQQ